MRKKSRGSRDLLIPQILEEVPGPWTIQESALDQASVDKHHRIAMIPPPYTEAQQLARLHEQYHIKQSPANWLAVAQKVWSMGADLDLNLDTNKILELAKMLEENRVDWRLWNHFGIDLRPAREMLDWGKMTYPDEPFEATLWVLQLAWTVWASDGFPTGKVPNPPPARDREPETAQFFEHCWNIVCRFDADLAKTIVRGLLYTYNHPSHRVRDRLTLELAQFFPPEKMPDKPAEREEEKEAQAEVAEIQDAIERARKESETGGVDNPTTKYGHYEIHDHTRGSRRPSTQMRRRMVPMDSGSLLKYPHRWMLDKAVFGRRHVSEGSLLIDLSGSMRWTNDDMMLTLAKMPNITIGSYSGVDTPDANIIGRICIHARNGRFNKFTGLEPENNKGNDIDLEALLWLERQPEPRFWLSDGEVTGGRLCVERSKIEVKEIAGREDIPPYDYRSMHAPLINAVNSTMKRARITRINSSADLRTLMQGRRITAYQKTFTLVDTSRIYYYGDLLPELDPRPCKIQV